MHCRLGLEVNCIWCNGEWQLIIQSRQPLWIILTGLGECFSVSHAVSLSVYQWKRPSILFVCIGISVCTCLTESDRMTGTASRFLRDNSRGKERPDKGGNGNLSFSSRLKCGSFFFAPSGWVVSGILWRWNYAPAFACLGFLSIFWLPG